MIRKKKWIAALLFALGLVLCVCSACDVGYVYEHEQYTVTYMNDEEVVEVQKYRPGDAVVFPATAPEKEADESYTYTFKGWNYTGSVTDDIVTGLTIGEDDVTLYAVFTPARILDPNVRTFKVTFRDNRTDELIRFRDPVTGETVSVQEVPEGKSALYPSKEEIPDHSSEYLMFDEWSVAEGSVITAPTVIYAMYKPTEYPVFMHLPGNVYESERPVSYHTEIVLPEDVSALGDPELLDSVFSIDGWFWDAEYTRPVEDPLVDAALLAEHGENGEFHVFAKCSLRLNEGYMDVQSSEATADLVYGMEIFARIRGLDLVKGLSLSYDWHIVRNGRVTDYGGEVYPLHDAGEYDLTCTVTIVYGEDLLTAVREYRMAQPVVVEKAALTAKAAIDRDSLIYGDPAPAVAMSYEGFRFDDGAEIVHPIHTYFNRRTGKGEDVSRLPAGNYTLETAFAELENYTVTKPEDLYFSVAKKRIALTLTVDDYVYGAGFRPVLGGLEALAYGEKPEVLGTPVYTVGSERKEPGDVLGAGSYRAVVSGLTSENYEIGFPTSAETFTVSKREFTVETTASGCVYGEMPVYSYEISYPGADAASLEVYRADEEKGVFVPRYLFTRGGEAYSRSGDGYFPQGEYTVSADLSKTYANYTLGETAPARFTVSRRPLELGIALDRETYTYGDRVSPSVTYSGFAEGENETQPSVITVPSGNLWTYYRNGSSDSYTSATFSAGSYRLVLTEGFRAGNYEILYPEAKQFVIQKKTLTLTVQLAKTSLVYGERPEAARNTTKGVLYEGFIPGESTGTLFSGTEAPDLIYRSAEDGADGPVKTFHVGKYLATVEAEFTNYEAVVTDAQFEVSPRDVTVRISFYAQEYTYGSRPGFALAYGDSAKPNDGFLNDAEKRAYTASVHLLYIGQTGARYTQTPEGEVLDAEGGAGFIGADVYSVTVEGFGKMDDYRVIPTGSLSLTVAPAALNFVLSVERASKLYTYGENPAIGKSVSGFVGGESYEVLQGGEPRPVLWRTKQGGSAEEKYERGDALYDAAGTYRVSLEGYESGKTYGNYRVNVTEVTYTIAQAKLTVEFSYPVKSFSYGEYSNGANGSYPSLVPVYTYRGLAKGEDETALGGERILSISYSAAQNGEKSPYTKAGLFDAGYYTVTLSGLVSENYEISYAAAQTFTVLRRAAKATVNVGGGCIYGSSPVIETAFENILPEDEEGFAFTRLLTYRASASSAFAPHEGERYNAGDYHVYLSYTANDNYTLTGHVSEQSAAAFTVGKAEVTVSVVLEKSGYQYGEKVSPKLRYEGLCFGEDGSDVIAAPADPFVYVRVEDRVTVGANTQFAVGKSYEISVSGSRTFTAANYSVKVGESASFTVEKRAVKLAIEGVDAQYVYGTNPSPRLVLAEGESLAYADTATSVLSGARFTYTGHDCDAERPYGFYQVGSYTVSAQLSNGNYAFEIPSAEFEVTPATLSVTVSATDYVYGGKLTAAFAVEGFVGERTESQRSLFMASVSSVVSRKDGKPIASRTYQSSPVYDAGDYVCRFGWADADAAILRNYRFTRDGEPLLGEDAEAEFTVSKARLRVVVSDGGNAFGDFVYDRETTVSPQFALDGMAYGEEAQVLGEIVYRLAGQRLGNIGLPADYLRADVYTLTASGFVSDNYEISYLYRVGGAEAEAVSFTVSPKAASVTVSADGWTYGDDEGKEAYHAFLTSSGFVDEDFVALSFEVKVAREDGKAVKEARYDAGKYILTLAYAKDSDLLNDYTIAFHGVAEGALTKEFTVSPKSVNVSIREASGRADGYRYSYGSDPVFEIVVQNGLLAADRETFLPGGLSLSYNTEKSGRYFDASVTPYTVRVENASEDAPYSNYSIVAAERTFYIDRFVVHFKNSESRIHWSKGGDWLATPGDLPAGVEFTGTVVLKDSGGTYTPGDYPGAEFDEYFRWRGGSYSITLDGKDVSQNFELNYSDISVTLLASKIVIGIDGDETRTYNGTEQTFTATATAYEITENITLSYAWVKDGAETPVEGVPTQKNAGTYTLKVTATEENGEETSQSFVITISPFLLTASAQSFSSGASAAYDGTSRTWGGVTVSPAAGSIPEADSGKALWSAEYVYSHTAPVSGSKCSDAPFTPNETTFADAGTYAFRATLTISDGNYAFKDSTAPEKNTLTLTPDPLTIARAQYGEVTVGKANTTYNGSLQSAAAIVRVAGVDGEALYGLTFRYGTCAEELGEALPQFRDAQTYSVYYTVAETDNYEAKSGSYSFLIAPYALTVTAPEERSLQYAGRDLFAQFEAQVEGGLAGETASLKYRLGTQGDFAETVALKDAKKYTISYQVVVKNGESDVSKNYTLGKGADLTGTYSVEITKAPLTVTIPTNLTKTYDGEDGTWAVTVGAGQNSETFTVKYSYTVEDHSDENKSNVESLASVKDAGTYHVSFTLVGKDGSDPENYDYTANAFDITIEKAQGTIGGLKKVKTAYTYTGEKQTIDLSEVKPNHNEAKVEFTSTIATLKTNGFTFTQVAEANDAQITATLAETRNYLGTSGKITIKVEKGANRISQSEFEEELGKVGLTYSSGSTEDGEKDESEYRYSVSANAVYKGSAFDLDSFTNLAGSFGGNLGYTVAKATRETAETIRNVGEYTVTFTISGSDNYFATKITLTVTIEKAEIGLKNVSDIENSYNGENQLRPIEKLKELLTLQGEDTAAGLEVSYDGTYTCKDAADDAYTVNFTVKESDNYERATGSYTIKIDPKQLTLQAGSGTHSYTAAPQLTAETVKAAVFDAKEALPEGDDPFAYSVKKGGTVVGFDGVKDVGKYSVTVSSNSGNYRFDEVTYTYTITKADYTVTIPTDLTKTYTGNSFDASVTFSGVGEESTPAGASVQYKLNEGDPYKESIAELNIVNWKDGGYTVYYCISGNPNYDDTTGSFTVTIAKANLNVSTVQEEYKVAYTGEARQQTITATGVNGESFSAIQSTDDDDFTNVKLGENGVTGRKVNYTFDAPNYYEANGTYTLVIEKAKFTVDTSSSSFSGPYDGGDHFIGVTVTMENGTLNPDDYKVQYRKGSDEVWSSSLSLKNSSDSGTISYQVIANGNDNFETATGSFTVTITKKGLTLSYVAPEKNPTYTGSNQKPEVTVEGFADGESLESLKGTLKYAVQGQKGEAQFINALAYNVTCTLSFDGDGGGNYSYNSCSFPYTIDPATLTGSGKEDLMFGAEYSVKDAVDITGFFGKDDYESIVDSASVQARSLKTDGARLYHADTYTVTFTLNSKNYTISPVEVTIKQKPSDHSPTLTLDGDFVMRIGKKLSDIPLGDSKLTWKTPGQEIVDFGEQSHVAVYDQDTDPDFDDYSSCDVTVTFTTRKEKITFSAKDIAREFEGADEANILNELKYKVYGEDDREITGEELQYIKDPIYAGGVNFDIGSTYLAKFEFTIDSNEYYEAESTVLQIIYELQSVQIGSIWYTIERALNNAASGQKIIVKYNTAFAEAAVAKVAAYYDFTTTPKAEYYTVKSGVTLLLPYSQNDTNGYNDSYDKNTTPTVESPALYITLSIGKEIELTNKGTIIVGALTGVAASGVHPQGKISGGYAEIQLNGKLISSGTLNVYGNITGEGTVEVLSGSVRERLEINDWQGGSISGGRYTGDYSVPLVGSVNISNPKEFPFKDYSVNSIRAKLLVHYGANYSTYAKIFTSEISVLFITLPAQFNTAEFTIASTNANNGLFALSPGATLTKTFKDGRTEIRVNGGATGGQATFELSVAIKTVSMGSGSVMFPIKKGLDIILENGTYTMPYGYKLLPDSSLTLTNGATLNMNNSTRGTIVYQGSDIVANDNQLFPTGKPDGILFVGSGCTLNLNGKFGGRITGEDGAQVVISSGASLTSSADESYGSRDGLTFTYHLINTVTHDLELVHGDSTTLVAENKTYLYQAGKWVAATNEIKFTVQYHLNYSGAVEEGPTEMTIYSMSDTITISGLSKEPVRAFYRFTGWYLDSSCARKLGEGDNIFTVSNGSKIEVYAGWEAVEYIVHFNLAGYGVDDTEAYRPEDLTWSIENETFTVPELKDLPGTYGFGGWFFDVEFKVGVNNANIQSYIVGDVIEIYGYLYQKPITVTFDINIGGIPDDQKDHAQTPDGTEITQLGDTLELPNANKYGLDYYDYDPSKLYYFAGWFTNDGSEIKADTVIAIQHLDTATGNLVLVAQWKKKVTLTLVGNQATDGGTLNYGFRATLQHDPGTYSATNVLKSGDNRTNAGYVKPGTKVTVIGYSDSAQSDFDNNRFELTILVTGDQTGINGHPNGKQEQTFTMNGNVTVEKYSSSGCFVEGTMITMADGTLKAVEDLQIGDKVLVFNHLTGKYETSEIWMMLHADLAREVRRIVNLNFSDGTTLRITYEHGLFDRTLGRYVNINEENVHDYIGHEFSSVEHAGGKYVDRKLTLVSAVITEEETKVYSPVTANHMNLVAEGMLTVTPMFEFFDAFTNVFEYNEDMTFNLEKMQKDIATYGLFTYEDFKDYIPYEVWQKAPVAYLKVAIGKGLITFEDIQWIIAYLNNGNYLN